MNRKPLNINSDYAKPIYNRYDDHVHSSDEHDHDDHHYHREDSDSSDDHHSSSDHDSDDYQYDKTNLIQS